MTPKYRLENVISTGCRIGNCEITTKLLSATDDPAEILKHVQEFEFRFRGDRFVGALILKEWEKYQEGGYGAIANIQHSTRENWIKSWIEKFNLQEILS